MWCVDHELEDFFEEVDRKRKEKFGSGSHDEESPMMKNDLAKGRGKK